MIKINPNGAGEPTQYKAVSPAGHLVDLPITSALKPGWRLATDADVETAVKAEEVRGKRSPAPVVGGPIKPAA